jgi:type I restriction enzyme S subunit
MARAIFKSWFIDFEPFGGLHPHGWEKGTFRNITTSMLGGDWGKEISVGTNTQMVYCIRGADIPDVSFGNKGKMPLRYINPKSYISKSLTPGDIVVEISGGSPTQSTGRCTIVTQSLLDRYDQGIICTNFCRAVKPIAGYSPFFYLFWKYLYSKNTFFSYENGTTGIKNLDISGFLDYEEIIIPPRQIVDQFNKIIYLFIDTIFANGLEIEKISNIRDCLLPRLMSGEVSVVNDFKR